MIASIVLAASVVVLAAPPEIKNSIDTFVAKAPGVVVAVGVINHGNVQTYFAGQPPSGAPRLDEHTEFQIGSITKTFTSTLLADMSLHGVVQLDDPIAKYLPSGTTAPSYHGTHITLLNLAEQNSGLPPMPTNLASSSNLADPYATYSVRELYAFLDSFRLERAPGTQFEYSNLGVGLLGTLLANAAHSAYPALLQTRVLAPLGMSSTSAELTPAVTAGMMPGFTGMMDRQGPWTITALAGAGAVNSNLHDMLLYLQANLNAPDGPLGKAMALAHQSRAASFPGQTIGLNWFIAPTGVIWHDGETGGYSSFLAFSPAERSGVVVLTNVAPGNGVTDELGAHILESQRYPQRVAFEPQDTKPHGNSPLVGVYEMAPAFKITVYEEGGSLYARATRQAPLVLTLASGDTYAVQGIAASITFQRDKAGKVTSLVLHQNGVDQIAPRVENP